ncbi:BadF/BadG/BcrA/BcrD ATPase family protein [Microbacterium betulae]|uniref:BadF/BadG/BcrA/BcrD ATPase family protein n=1 Tax=Microbacterium betulae TaxID=2981139 RepID=A0AA97FG36_9MICO|nr:BadF/BadG/BcrA/BcrD ATPase family protein [Microbacterium sp. AB]WOF22375.1 BadF/BadG/BcrA/BcrD ATPase family protein [Microbacterium sp. AB]
MTKPGEGWLVGIDVGASGARARAISGEAMVERSGPGAVASDDGAGIAIRAVIEQILAVVEPHDVVSLGVGATGIATLAGDRGGLKGALGGLAPGAVVVLAADAVTAHLGALSGRAGVTVAAGTGAIGIAQTEDGSLHRVDGWGHLLGDVGSGAWIGQRALVEAMRAYDVRDASGRALLERGVERFGPTETWPAQLYGRDDRAAVMASFVPDVIALAEKGDEAARRILDAAAEGLAETARAALSRPGVPPRLALTGGLFSSAALFRGVASRAPDGVEVVSAEGTPLDGAVRLARMATGTAPRLRERDLIVW